jgi:hypothetical protein
MPNVSYYLGRPARFWIAVVSGAARATAANPAAAASLAGPQPSAPAPPRRTPQEPSAPATTAASTSPLKVCGSSWLTSQVVCWHSMSCVCRCCLEHDLFAVEVYKSLPASWQILPVRGDEDVSLDPLSVELTGRWPDDLAREVIGRGRV